AHDLSIVSQNPLLNWISTMASWRSRLTRIPYGDQVIFIRRSMFDALDGYPNIPILEDVALMKKMKRCQASIQILRDPVLISPRRWQKEGIVFTTVRNWMLLLLYELGVSPYRLVAWYRPHQSS
ncbi:MAG: glycosyl transferase, partial [Cyanobacteria bacterium P01_F01_bin.42]